MPELRRDYSLDRWVIFATERAKRPSDFKRPKARALSHEKKCPFCPGNEHLTPPEIMRVEEKGEWTIRVFPNKFPAVTLDGSHELFKDNTLFIHSFGYGKHEVVVDTPKHNKQLGDLPVSRIENLFWVFQERSKALKKISGIEYIAIFRNEGQEAGISLLHSHSQIVAFSQLAPAIENEVNAVQAYMKRHKSCPYCDIIKEERNGERKVFENKTFIAICPYASRFAFEVMILCKRHKLHFPQLDKKERRQLAEIIKKVLVKLKRLNAPYNMYIHDSQKGKQLHFHIKINPRLLSWGGFEHETGSIINTILPETAAKFYKGK